MIRDMAYADLEQVLEVEQQAHSIPWKEKHFQNCLEAGYRCLVLEEQGNIIAYFVFHPVLEEANLLNIAVLPSLQGKGYGQTLMHALFDMARVEGCSSVFLEVRESNQQAVRLYEKLGFSEIARRKDYYPAIEGRENAIVMNKTLTQ